MSFVVIGARQAIECNYALWSGTCISHYGRKVRQNIVHMIYLSKCSNYAGTVWTLGKYKLARVHKKSLQMQKKNKNYFSLKKILVGLREE